MKRKKKQVFLLCLVGSLVGHSVGIINNKGNLIINGKGQTKRFVFVFTSGQQQE